MISVRSRSAEVSIRLLMRCIVFVPFLVIALELCPRFESVAARVETEHPIASTNAGKVRRYVDNGISVFKGIPYGDDTTKRRFMPPVAPPACETIRNAVDFVPIARQPVANNKPSYP